MLLLLLHGTWADNARAIAKQGFDEALSQRALYGRGVYFTTDACKVAQYPCSGYRGIGSSATSGCIIVARVVLGHPYMADEPMNAHMRPSGVRSEPDEDEGAWAVGAQLLFTGLPIRTAGPRFAVQADFDLVSSREDIAGGAYRAYIEENIEECVTSRRTL